MYFSLIPDIKYNLKPINYPFSESDYITAKNFFRRFQVNQDLFSYSVYYKKYAVVNGDRLDTIANEAFGDPSYDWVIALTNNMINPMFGLPLNDAQLAIYTEEKYGFDNAYSGVHHYETLEVKTDQEVDGITVNALEAGIIVDQNFFTGSFEYWDGSEHRSIPGNIVSKPVTNYEYEISENEKKREIFILRPAYFTRFVSEFKSANKYSDSSDFISERLKKVAV
tara:strand:- start:26 stop:697 length:672 start_codon:yes stop_codon:yes gene_type:complete